MKSFLDVRSQSHTSTDRRLSHWWPRTELERQTHHQRGFAQYDGSTAERRALKVNILLLSSRLNCNLPNVLNLPYLRKTSISRSPLRSSPLMDILNIPGFYLRFKFICTHKVKLSFQTGLSVDRMVLVFCLLWLFGSGINLSLTYGSDRPFGSMGIRLRASSTGEEKKIRTEC